MFIFLGSIVSVYRNENGVEICLIFHKIDIVYDLLIQLH